MADAPVRVLLVEDDADDFVLTRDYLADVASTRYTVDWVATYDAALEALGRNEHDVCLLDYRLGEHDGLELLREAIQRGVRSPLILLTGQGDRAVDIEAMRSGAADFLNKGRLEADLLERSIRYAIERKQTEEALRRMHDELEQRVEERTAQLARTNVALHAEIRERQRAEEQIKASLKEKEVLLREIHHRVKNNLQVITTLFNLQSKTIKDDQARELIRESQNRVKSMALIHEKLYRARDLARVDFAQYVRSLATHLLRSYAVDARRVDLQITAENVCLGVDTAIPCGLIINELVCNALRHAFPGERTGQIQIDLRSGNDNRYVLTVRDDGVGFPRDLDFQNTESLGLQIVTALTQQLEGTIELGPEKGTGTTFTITFSELKYKERG
jgi:two-component sensor histidine kinase/ActR/RegA family two-component response regulator